MFTIEKLSWDSEFFGYPVASIYDSDQGSMDVRGVIDWVHQNRPHCIYFMKNSTNLESEKLISTLSFTKITSRFGYRCLINDPITYKSQSGIMADPSPEHMAQIEELSSSLFYDSRFYLDNNICKDKASDMFRMWVANSASTGRSNVFYGLSEYGDIAGFLLIKIKLGHAVIDLVGVAESARRNGWGRRLVNHALDFASSLGLREVLVGTQSSNAPALGLYEKLGFKLVETSTWYHSWPKWKNE